VGNSDREEVLMNYSKMSDVELAELWTAVASGLTDDELDPILLAARKADYNVGLPGARDFSIFCLNAADSAGLV
jgi:hypothetical protein